MSKLFKNFKLVIIITLAIILVGAIFLGIFGFNKTTDYKNSYEIDVSVSVDLGSKDILKTEADKYFNEKGLSYFSYQSTDKSDLIFKFDSDITVIDAEEFEQRLQSALSEPKYLGVEVKVSLNTTVNGYNTLGGWVILAGGISLVVLFVFLLFTHKLSGAVSVIVSMLVSLLIYASIIAITRIPASPIFTATAFATAVLTGAISVSIVDKCKVALKGDTSNTSSNEISEKVINNFAGKTCEIGGTVLLISVLLIVVGIIWSSYLTFVGLQILVLGIASIFTPLCYAGKIWSLIVNKKGKAKAVKQEEITEEAEPVN